MNKLKTIPTIYLLLLSYFPLFFISCDSKKSKFEDIEIETSDKTIVFENLDSIKINYLGNPTVHDLDPKSGTVLFMEHRESSEEIHIADFEGNVNASFSKRGDMPDSYGALMSTLRIQDNNTFLVYGYNGFMVYDFEGNLQSQVKLDDFQVPSSSWINMGFGMEKMGNRYVYLNQGKPPENSQEYKEFPLLSWLDPQSGKKEPFIQFPERSMFSVGKFFFMRSWFPVYCLEENRIYLVFGAEPMIYVYENQHLISSIPIQLPSYNYFKGADSSSDLRLFGMSMITGMIVNIKKIDGFFLIAYFPGYSRLDMETNFENKSPDESKAFRERMLKKYPNRIAILDSAGNLINDFVPGKLEPRSMLVRNGELWMIEKPDEEKERDFFRLFRVGLKRQIK